MCSAADTKATYLLLLRRRRQRQQQRRQLTLTMLGTTASWVTLAA